MRDLRSDPITVSFQFFASNCRQPPSDDTSRSLTDAQRHRHLKEYHSGPDPALIETHVHIRNQQFIFPFTPSPQISQKIQLSALPMTGISPPDSLITIQLNLLINTLPNRPSLPLTVHLCKISASSTCETLIFV